MLIKTHDQLGHDFLCLKLMNYKWFREMNFKTRFRHLVLLELIFLEVF